MIHTTDTSLDPLKAQAFLPFIDATNYALAPPPQAAPSEPALAPTDATQNGAIPPAPTGGANADGDGDLASPDEIASEDPLEKYAQLIDRVKKFVSAKVILPRTNRVGLEDFWRKMYMIWAAQNETNTRLYVGMSDQFLPTTHVLLETLIDHARAQLLPPGSDIAVIAKGKDPLSALLAPVAESILAQMFDQANIFEYSEQWMRQAKIFGVSPIKCVWDAQTSTNYATRVIGIGPDGKPLISNAGQSVTLFEGPTFLPVNLLRFYVHPFNARSLDEAETVFEDVRVNIDYLNSEAAAGRFDPVAVQRVIENKENYATQQSQTQTQGHIDSRTALYGLFETSIKDDDLFLITEIWCKFDLYGKGERIPCKITVCNDEVLELRQNPYIHQKPPYVLLYNKSVMEHIYGRSSIQNVETLNLAQNAAFNQGIDANMFATNQMMILNGPFFQGNPDDLEVAPLMQFVFNAPPGVAVKDLLSFVAPPNTLGANIQLVQTLQDMMERALSAPPMLMGEMPQEETTATATAAAAQGAMVGVNRDVVQAKMALRRWLQMAWMLCQQFLSTKKSVQVSLNPTITAEPSAIVGSYSFDFLTGAEAQQAKMAQQAAMEQALNASATAGRRGAAVSANKPDGNGENNAPPPGPVNGPSMLQS